MPFAADCETPYSLTSHFAVAGSISVMLIRSPCFLQNSSNDLSVTNVSTSLSWPADTPLCTSATVTPRRSAARSHVYPSSPLARVGEEISGRSWMEEASGCGGDPAACHCAVYCRTE